MDIYWISATEISRDSFGGKRFYCLLSIRLTMSELDEINELIVKHRFEEYKWLNAKDIIVAQWVRFKCMFGCRSYGQKASCPPNTLSVNECREFINDFEKAIIFHFAVKLERPEDRYEYCTRLNERLLDLEREIFLAGYYKAFLLFLDECRLCKECKKLRNKCEDKRRSRPTAEGLGVDVFTTARNCGYPIEVLQDFDKVMNRYAFILIE